MQIIKARVMNRVGTEAEWLATNPVILKGEIALVIIGKFIKFKIGDGVKTFSQLTYNVFDPTNLKGKATPATDPGHPIAPELWVGETGVYPKFGNVEITAAAGFIIWDGNNWSVVQFNINLKAYVKKTDLPQKNVLLDLPDPKNGYYATPTGIFYPSVTYKSYVLSLLEYTKPIFVTGNLQDAGTSLAFYFDENGDFISSQFIGTPTVVNYIKQELTPPDSAVLIAITVLSSGPIEVYGGVIADDILTQSISDLLYLRKEDAENIYIPLKLYPGGQLPIEETTDYNNVVFADAVITNPDTNLAYYANYVGVITVDGEKLSKIRVKVSGATTIKLKVIIDSPLNVIHTYSDVAVTKSGEYLIDDDFALPINSYIAISDTNKKLFYKSGDGNNSYRIDSDFKNYGVSKAQIAFNFTTKKKSLKNDLLTYEKGDQRYIINGGGSLSTIKQVKLKMTAFAKIILYGTSRSSTDYPWFKDSMEDLVGCECYNGGFSGGTAAFLAGNAQLQRIFNYKPHLILVEAGANDTGEPGTVGTFGAIEGEPIVNETDINVDYNGTYFIQAIDHMIRKIKAQYYNIRARANLTGSENEAERSAKIEAVLKPYYAFCTSYPQKRVDASNVFTNKENQERKNRAFIEACNKNNVHCIDVYNLISWDMSLEPYWPNATDLINNYGVMTMDGLHANKYGCYQLAQLICGQLGII